MKSKLKNLILLNLIVLFFLNSNKTFGEDVRLYSSNLDLSDSDSSELDSSFVPYSSMAINLRVSSVNFKLSDESFINNSLSQGLDMSLNQNWTNNIESNIYLNLLNYSYFKEPNKLSEFGVGVMYHKLLKNIGAGISLGYHNIIVSSITKELLMSQGTVIKLNLELPIYSSVYWSIKTKGIFSFLPPTTLDDESKVVGTELWEKLSIEKHFNDFSLNIEGFYLLNQQKDNRQNLERKEVGGQIGLNFKI